VCRRRVDGVAILSFRAWADRLDDLNRANARIAQFFQADEKKPSVHEASDG
jgi:hypothetical protein